MHFCATGYFMWGQQGEFLWPDISTLAMYNPGPMTLTTDCAIVWLVTLKAVNSQHIVRLVTYYACL